MDVVSVAADVGNEYRSFIVELMQVTPTAANIDHYIILCREQSRILRIRELGQQLSTADNETAIRSLIEKESSGAADFGNARGIRNLLERCIRRKDSRIASAIRSGDEVKDEDLVTILREDMEWE